MVTHLIDYPAGRPVPFHRRALQIAGLLRQEIGQITLHGRDLRTQNKVSQEYDQNTWKKYLEEKRWTKCRDLDQYVIFDDSRDRIAKIGGRLVQIKTCDYYRFRRDVLRKILAALADDSKEMVELGCGVGLNIFSLAGENRWQRLEGFDISQNGITAAREAAEFFGLKNVYFDLLDLTDPDHPNWVKVRGKQTFTYMCLEQLKHSMGGVLNNIVRAGPRRVIHIENAYELLNWLSPSDWVTALYIRRMDYQDNLLTTLRKLEKLGRLNILLAQRLYYAPTPRNDPMLVVWEPRC